MYLLLDRFSAGPLRGVKKDGSKEAYQKNFRRMLHEGGAEGGARGKGLKKGRGSIYQSLGLSLFSRPLLLPTFDALLQRHVGAGGTAGLDANSPRAQLAAPDHSSYGTLNQHRITSRPTAS